MQLIASAFLLSEMHAYSKSVYCEEHLMLVTNFLLKKEKNSKLISQNMLIIHGEKSLHFTSFKTNQLTLPHTPFVSKSTLEYKGLRCFSSITLNVFQHSILKTIHFYLVCIFCELPLFSVVGPILKIHLLLGHWHNP